MQLMQREAVTYGPDHDDVLLAARDPSSYGALASFAQRGGEQRVRLRAALVGRQIISPVKIHRIHGFQRNELADVDRVTRRIFEFLQFLRAEHHVLVFGELIALDHFRAFDDFSVVDGNVLLLYPGAILLAQQIEGEALRGDRRRVELDGDGDQSEGDGQRSNGSSRCSHEITIPQYTVGVNLYVL